MAKAGDLRSWLTAFETSLNAQDVASVTALFAENECYWRDLVAFTWNIATVEGRAGVADMLRSPPAIEREHVSVLAMARLSCI